MCLAYLVYVKILCACKAVLQSELSFVPQAGLLAKSTELLHSRPDFLQSKSNFAQQAKLFAE
jgi:hypothetical protein